TAFAAADLSGFAQSTGYLLAAIGPVAFGYLHDVTGGWTIPVWTFLLATLALFITSYIASKDVFIDHHNCRCLQHLAKLEITNSNFSNETTELVTCVPSS
ncbi:hypothetical protein LGW89_09055, partial [Streptococcus mutans]|nr:hypothetical protein [Streptococcus mutans]